MSDKILFVVAFYVGIAAAVVCILLHARKRLAEIRCDPPEDIVRTRPKTLTVTKEMIMAAERVERQNPTPPDEPPLALGDKCYFLYGVDFLNDEEPRAMLVVDANPTHVLASWGEGAYEQKFPRTVVRRYRPNGGLAVEPGLPGRDAWLAKPLPAD